LRPRTRTMALVGLIVALAAAGWIAKSRLGGQASALGTTAEPRTQASAFHPTPTQWAALTLEPVQKRVFRSEHVTEGKIAIDEDRSTPIFSPYAGRVIKLFVKPGDTVKVGQPLFSVQANDMVQAQNDFISAATGLNKARSALHLAEIVNKRQVMLYEGKAVPLKEVQNAKAALEAAENDLRSAEVALEAARNRLRILGKTDQEITAFQEKGTIDPTTPIFSPIDGTIVQRKVGPGQYIGAGASDPVFIVGDLDTVWLVAYVRETVAPAVHVGQAIYFTVLAYPDERFPANISYVAAALDPTSRRLLVRATVNNSSGLFKPEMFANVTILTGEGDTAVAVPRDAVIYEGEAASVWVATGDKALELRRVKVGLSNGSMVQIVDGLSAQDRVVTHGSLFIDRLAANSRG
jgi:cobalt-zinc-cadmium efflux system membrane fusion protein